MTKGGIKIYCDGGARGNPGPAAAAFVVVDKGKVVHRESRYLGVATNNVAEYRAVQMALAWLVNNSNHPDGNNVSLFLDSQLVTRQLSGLYKIKSKNLRPIIASVKDLEQKTKAKIIYKAVLRSKNRLADFLVNKVLDEKN